MLRLSELRNLKAVTQHELAQIIGVKNYTIANWEQGRSEPSIHDLCELAIFFKCSIDYLVGREDEFGVIAITNNPQLQIFDKFLKLQKNKQILLTEIIESNKLLKKNC